MRSNPLKDCPLKSNVGDIKQYTGYRYLILNYKNIRFECSIWIPGGTTKTIPYSEQVQKKLDSASCKIEIDLIGRGIMDGKKLLDL
ncbi:hypothetical protein CYANOKiyG1_14480 [Okeania sp. KiyG1]|nr:hypothetical protein CYANOKiyG1_14480 [Okeania sp. KiyG1]